MNDEIPLAEARPAWSEATEWPNVGSREWSEQRERNPRSSFRSENEPRSGSTGCGLGVRFDRYAVGRAFPAVSVGSHRCAPATHGYSRSAAMRLRRSTAPLFQSGLPAHWSFGL